MDERSFYVRSETDVRLLMLALTVAVALGILSVILWLFLRQRTVNRLNDMSRITEKMARLEFDEKVDYHGRDELGVLAESIDRMSDKLQSSIDGMQKELTRRENLVRNLAHDVRTPLTVIRGYAESLTALHPEDERLKRYISVIIDECDRMTKMSEDLLEFIAIRDQEDYYTMELIDAKELFGEFVRRLNNIHPDIMFLIDYDQCQFVASWELLEQAVYNLMENAIKYGKQNGVVQLYGKKEDEYYRFSVANEGEGIQEEDLEYIWDAFYKGDKARKRGNGFGIGLSIVRDIAVMHSGDVDAISRGGWTTLSFRIRRRRPEGTKNKKLNQNSQEDAS